MAAQGPGILTNAVKSANGAGFDHWVCYQCQHVWQQRKPPPRHCRQCGTERGYVLEPIPLLGSRSCDVAPIAPGVLVSEWLHLLPRGLPFGLTMVMRGRPGGGKSRAGFRLASQIGTSMVFGLEMGKELSTETGRDAGALLENCWWYDDIAGLDELSIIDPACVVVDSLQKLRKRKSIVKRLRDWARDFQRNVIFISQKGHHGASRHGEDDDFDCDVVVDVEPGMVEGVQCVKAHAMNEKPSQCREGCAHVRIAKARVAPLVSGDVPIVAGY